MNQNKNHKLKLKPFISFLTIFIFLALAFSGFILYIKPEGSLARWIGWQALGLEKSRWEALHLILCSFFVLTAVLHLILNFRAVLIYLSSGIEKTRKNLAEMALAFFLVVVLMLTALINVPPSSWLAQGRASFKNNPASLRVRMPFPDFEKQSLPQVAAYLGLELNEVVARLKNQEIKLSDVEASLEKISQENGLAPQDIFLLLRP